MLAACSSTSSIASSGVDASAQPTPDPPGTVVSQLRTAGNGPNVIDFESGKISGIGLASGDLELDAAGNLAAGDGNGPVAPASIADVGAVGGLGDVTDVPGAGFSASAAAVVGDGYVVKTSEGNVYRVYVVSNILSAADHGVIGVVIRWVLLVAKDAGSSGSDASSGD